MRLQPISRFYTSPNQNYSVDNNKTNMNKSYDIAASNNKIQGISFEAKTETIKVGITKVIGNRFNHEFLPKNETSAIEYVKKFKNLIIENQNDRQDNLNQINIFRINSKKPSEKQKIHSYDFVGGNLITSESFYPNGKTHFTFNLNGSRKLKTKITRRKNFKEIPIEVLLHTRQAPWINKIETYRANGKLKSVDYFNKDGYVSKTVRYDKMGRKLAKK